MAFTVWMQSTNGGPLDDRKCENQVWRKMSWTMGMLEHQTGFSSQLSGWVVLWCGFRTMLEIIVVACNLRHLTVRNILADKVSRQIASARNVILCMRCSFYSSSLGIVSPTLRQPRVNLAPNKKKNVKNKVKLTDRIYSNCGDEKLMVTKRRSDTLRSGEIVSVK